MTTVGTPDSQHPPPPTSALSIWRNNRSFAMQHFEMCKNLIKSELFIRIQRVWELNTNKNSSAHLRVLLLLLLLLLPYVAQMNLAEMCFD